MHSPKPFLLGESGAGALAAGDGEQTEMRHGTWVATSRASGADAAPQCWRVEETRVRHRMASVTWRSLRATRASLVPRGRCERSYLYALLAYDWVLDAHGEPVLLEVNSHPAIADGTMADVPTDVYTTLVTDVLGALVLPALEGRQAAPGGFEPVEGWAVDAEGCG